MREALGNSNGIERALLEAALSFFIKKVQECEKSDSTEK
jgi:hypothetical protein